MTEITWSNETRKLSELTPWERNPRRIAPAEAERLEESLIEFGQVHPICIEPDGQICDGHQRQAVWQMSEKFGPDYVVDVRVASRSLAERERQKLTVYLHRGAHGTWDFDLLADTFALNDLLEWGFDEDELGLFVDEDDGAGVDAEPQIDRAEELREQWGVETGQLWALGEHRLICGDCTDADVVARVMDGEKANLLFTSPPYWVGMEYETQKSEADINDFIKSCVDSWTKHVSCDFGRIIVNTGTAAIHRVESGRRVEVLPLVDKYQAAFRSHGWIARHIRIWAKGGDFPASISPRTDVVDQRWEHLVYFSHEQMPWEYIVAFWAPDGEQRGQEQIWTEWAQQGVWSDIQGDRSAGGNHVAAFPVELPLRHILLYSKVREIVLEPFCGAGTTILACEDKARNCRAIELSPEYAAVTLQRFLDSTGKTPELLT